MFLVSSLQVCPQHSHQVTSLNTHCSKSSSGERQEFGNINIKVATFKDKLNVMLFLPVYVKVCQVCGTLFRTIGSKVYHICLYSLGRVRPHFFVAAIKS